jgi:hypothetical protein
MLVLLFSLQLNWPPAFGDPRTRDVRGAGQRRAGGYGGGVIVG